MKIVDYRTAKRIIIIRRVFAEVISLLPFNAVRCWAYRALGYHIEKTVIGWRTVIAVENLKADHAVINRRNRIVGPFTIDLRKHAAIGSDNEIVCGFWPLREDHRQFSYKRQFVMEECSLITSRHFIDVVDRVRIGAGTHVAGIRCEFWTHGHSGQERDIDIGRDCFVGSSCIFTPGSGLADQSIVGAGSVVSKKHRNTFSLLSGVPAKVLRESYYWRSRGAVDRSDPPPLPDNIRNLQENRVADSEERASG